MHPDMDAVVVTHNSAEDIRSLIASHATMSAFRRVIVIDNASSDETCTVASDGGLEVIPRPVNRGLAAGANLGARQTEGPCFALLNPDIRFAEVGNVLQLQHHLSNSKVGAVAPALVLPDGEIQDSARRVPTPTDLLLRRFTGRHPDVVRADRPVDVEWAVAACLLIRRSAFERIGGLDESYFLYFEDVDLGVRLADAGYTVRYDPTVRVFHRHRAASRSNLINRSTRHHIRSALRFYVGHPRYLFHSR
jgi:N-acetylglucosaminyl-diphospho-decaprenol L-rhamnosyltransferase